MTYIHMFSSCLPTVGVRCGRLHFARRGGEDDVQSTDVGAFPEHRRVPGPGRPVGRGGPTFLAAVSHVVFVINLYCIASKIRSTSTLFSTGFVVRGRPWSKSFSRSLASCLTPLCPRSWMSSCRQVVLASPPQVYEGIGCQTDPFHETCYPQVIKVRLNAHILISSITLHSAVPGPASW